MSNSYETIGTRRPLPSEIPSGPMVKVRGGSCASPEADYVPRATRRIKEAAELQQRRMEFWLIAALIGGFFAGHLLTLFALLEPVR